jgi:hypothetical protein
MVLASILNLITTIISELKVNLILEIKFKIIKPSEFYTFMVKTKQIPKSSFKIIMSGKMLDSNETRICPQFSY